MTDHIGQRFGDYLLTRWLGGGGFGDVYLGEHIYDKTFAAVKVLQTRLTSNEDLEEFINEARTFRLRHPHIVQLLDFGIGASSVPFLVMDYAPNDTLRHQHPKGTQLPLPTIVLYIRQAADALQYAHDRRLIHRDVKPENMLLGPNNEVLLSDFGIAVVAHSSRSLDTQGGGGTVPYMAPEQIRGKPRPASDQYALGIIVYEWLCGTRPFNGTATEIAMQHMFEPPPSLREKVPTIPPEVEKVVFIALEKDPQQRFGSVQAFAQALTVASEQANQSKSSILPPTTLTTPQKVPTLPSPSDDRVVPLPTTPLAQVVNSHPSNDGPVPTKPEPQSVGSVGTEGDLGPKSIELPQTLGETSSRSPIPVVQQNTPTIKSTPKQRNTRKMAVVGAASVAAWAVARGRIARAGRARGGLIVVLLLLLIPLLALLYGRYLVPVSNTVTITPTSADLKNIYTISAVTGTPVPSQQQVGARQLSSSTPVQSKTITATGSGQNSGVQAIGTLTFFNGSTSVQTVGSGTRLTGSNGVVVITDEPAVIPAANPPTYGSVTISAHAATVGASGNIGPGSINGTCCIAGGFVTVRNSQFAGGRDPLNSTFVQQSDIDGVATPLQTSLMQTAQAALQSQVRSNEQIADHPQCTPKVTSDHQAGDKAPSVTVTVTVTCTAEAYDHQGTISMAENLLRQEVAKNPGPGYGLVGNLVTTVTQTTVTDPNKGTLSVLVKAEGIWAYQFSDAQKQALAKQIAGKKTHDAQTLLSQQPGVAKVAIQEVNDDTLPTDFRQIKLVLQSIPGVQASTTPTT